MKKLWCSFRGHPNALLFLDGDFEIRDCLTCQFLLIRCIVEREYHQEEFEEVLDRWLVDWR